MSTTSTEPDREPGALGRAVTDEFMSILGEPGDVGDMLREKVIAVLRGQDYEVLRRRSVERLRRDLAIAKAQVEFEERSAEHARRWAHDCLERERRLGARCTFLYGKAIEAGAAEEDLRGTDPAVDPSRH